MFIINSLRKKWANFFLCKSISNKEGKNKQLLMKNIYNTHCLNQDFELSYNITTNIDLLNNIFACNDLKQLSDMLNMTEEQTKFVIKNIRSKIDYLLTNI